MEALGSNDPTSVGKYQLTAVLGTGGMGRVYLAHSPSGRRVAIKVIRADLVQESEIRQRFAREVAASRAVSGFFTAGVVDADIDADPPWLATTFIPGPSLRSAVHQIGPLSAASARAIGAALAEALSAIHAVGLIHRDLKPGNILLASDGPRLIDFGISALTGSQTLTSTGAIMGSPGYMSPEQIEGRAVGPATDVFALGAVVAFAVTGRDPFGGDSMASSAYRTVHAQPDLSQVPDDLLPLVRSCLEKDPSQRPDLRTLLHDFTSGQDLASMFARGWLPAALTRETDPADAVVPAEAPTARPHPAEAPTHLPALATVPPASPPAPPSQTAGTTRPPVQPGPVPGAGSPAQTSPVRRRLGLVAAVLIAVVGLGVAASFVLSGAPQDGNPSTGDLAVPGVGTCYLTRVSSKFNPIGEQAQRVACTEQHTLETIASGKVDAAANPEPPAVASRAARDLYARCETAAEKFLGAPWRTTYTMLTLSLPSADAWQRGATWYRCDLAASDFVAQETTIQVTGTLKGSANPIKCLSFSYQGTTPTDIEPRDCTAPHHGEFAGLVRLPDTQLTGEALRTDLINRCKSVVLAFLGSSRIADELAFWFLRDATVNTLDRNVPCVVAIERNGGTLAGSLRGIGAGAIPVS